MRFDHHRRISRTRVIRISPSEGLSKPSTIGMPAPSLAITIDDDLTEPTQLLLTSDLFYLLTLSATHVAVFAFQFCIFSVSNVTKTLIRSGWAACAVVTTIALPCIASAPSTPSQALRGEEPRGVTVRRTNRGLMTVRHSY
jgi:hypothetical protein